MAVRPPRDDASDPGTIEFGIAALDARLDADELEFPATSDDILRAVGDPEIPYDASGRTVPLDEALAALPRDRFESESELLELLHPVFEEYRSSASNSFLRQLRALLPF